MLKTNLSKTEKNLNTFLADLQILNAKLKHFHWYVKGEQFFRLHAKFEDLFDEAHTLIDEIAERNLQIGGSPISSLSEYLENSSLKEETRHLKSDEMVRALISDYEYLVEQLKDYSDVAAADKDKATEDMLIDIVSSFELTLWMLNAYMSNEG